MAKQKKESEKKFTFSSLFQKSVDDYKSNFKPILKLVLIFSGIILLVSMLFQVISYISNETVFQIASNPDLIEQYNTGLITFPLYYSISNVILSLISFFLTLFVSASLISVSVKKSKFSYKDLFEMGKSKYWKYFGLSIVTGIFILLLTLLLIIPGIIFGVYWAFVAYVFFDKDKKIMDSLKESRKIVKGRWWKTFGYILLFGLISLLIMIVASVVELPTYLIMMANIFSSTDISLAVLIISSVTSMIYQFLVALVISPLFILFLKNFYLEMKKGVKESPEKKLKETKKKVKPSKKGKKR